MPVQKNTIMILKTFNRKMKKSLGQRGLKKTAERCLLMPLYYLRSFKRSLSPSQRRRLHSEKQFDSQFGIDTWLGRNPGWMAEIDSPNWKYGRGYHPAPSESLTLRLRDLGILYEDFIFIDLGSGKGRSLFLASAFPFLEIIGVEYSRHLHDIAEKNIKNFQSQAQKCYNISSVCTDAANFSLPQRPAVIYFYDPFGEPVMRQVVDQIHESLKSFPRKLFIIYFNPVFAEMFEESIVFFRRTYGSEFLNYWRRTLQGNKDVNEFATDELDDKRFVVYESKE